MKTDIQFYLQDWLNLDAKRLIIPDSFDFKIETIGVFENITIVQMAINIIIKRLKKIIEIYSTHNKLVLNSESTIPNSFDIILENEDYTIGKILEYSLYHNYYINSKELTYCGFRKAHPHIPISIIRIAFKEPKEKKYRY